MKRTMVTVAVGSENPSKIYAVTLAWKTLWPEQPVTITGVTVASGVSEQPRSNTESIQGARNRAAAAQAKLKTDFGVGLEGGIQKIGDHYFSSGWAVIRDAKGNEGIGSSLLMMVPPAIMTLIEQGVELGKANDIVFKKHNSKHAEGYFGTMTNNVITRSQGYRDGIIAALVRFVHPHLFD